MIFQLHQHPPVPGAQMNYFCPKRFNRFPRFSAVYKGTQQAHLENKTVSLTSEIMGLEPSAADQTQFDPFQKVQLIRDIDNQILTSFRTLKGDNNLVSRTQKIIHRNFKGSKSPQSRYYQSHALHMQNKFPFEQIEEEVYDQLSDNIFEEVFEAPIRNLLQNNIDDLIDTIHDNEQP